MKTSQPRKRRERHLLEAFIQLSRVDATILEEREAPDFILDVAGRRVGLELTEIFVQDDGNAQAPKARESLAARVIAHARREYETRGGKPLHVAVGFIPQTDFRTLNRAGTAVALAEFLLKQDISRDGFQTWDFTSNAPLPSEIHFLNAYAVPDQECAHWYAPHAGWIAPLTEGILRSCIESKAVKLPLYQSVTQENWLVLVAAGGAPSQAFERKPDLCWEAIPSPFARTYLLSLIDGGVQEIGRRHAA